MRRAEEGGRTKEAVAAADDDLFCHHRLRLSNLLEGWGSWNAEGTIASKATEWSSRKNVIDAGRTAAIFTIELELPTFCPQVSARIHPRYYAH